MREATTMRRLSVADVMTTEVVSVDEQAPFKRIAELMATHHVSALPVLSPDGRVAGVVSEADLLLRQERPHAAGELPLFESRDRRIVRGKVTAAVASGLMSSPAVTAGPHESLAEVARRMHACRVKRLPVVDSAGRMAGIVARADLLKAFVRSDAGIRRDVVGELRAGAPAVDPALVRVEVADGRVRLAGRVGLASQAAALVRLAEDVDGVTGVDDGLEFDVDDRFDRILATYPYLY
jgi:CBS domain-containing protein